MPKVNPLTILGGVLVLTGLAGPWFSFFMIDNSIGDYWHFDMSPFILTIKVSKVTDPFKEIINSSCFHFYGADTSLIGFACILGSILSFFGGYMDKWRFTLLDGAIALLSTISFSMCLPGYRPGLSVGWGSTVSFLGAIIIISSLSLPFIIEKDAHS